MLVGHRPSNASERPSKVRGRPFQPGNPGRPRGSKNKTTQLIEQLLAVDAEELIQKMIALGKAGNVRSLEYCLDRLIPKRASRSLDLELPTINTPHDLIAAMAKLTAAVNNGEISAEETAHLVYCLEAYRRIFTLAHFEVRLEALEMQIKDKKE